MLAKERHLKPLLQIKQGSSSMLAETRSLHRSTTRFPPIETFPMMDQSDPSYDAPRRTRGGKRLACNFFGCRVTAKKSDGLARRLVLDRALAGSTDVTMVTDLFPMHVDVAGFEKATTLQNACRGPGTRAACSYAEILL